MSDPRDRTIEAAREIIDRALGSNNDARGALAALVAIANDPVIAHEVPVRRPIDLALTHGRQAIAELDEMLDWISQSLGDDSEEWKAVKGAASEVEAITARWADERERWVP